MPGLPIPTDWDGDSWQCVQIQWPDSIEWFGILSGLLSTMFRGRTWDEQTGSIIDIQEIGWQIYNRNVPYIDCAGEPINGGDTAIGGCVGNVIDFTEVFMSLCGYNPNAFKIENGSLWVGFLW
jgi:hypothetical protein